MDKAVFTLCTRFDIKKPTITGGFLDYEAYASSIILSMMLAKENIGRIELYTDTVGKALIDRLGLDVDAVHVVYDDFDYPHPLWVASKLLTFSVQQEPFIHLDLDAYLWSPLPKRLSGAAVVAQSSEEDWPSYTNAVNYLMEKAKWVPDFIRLHWLEHGGKIFAINAGAYGGADLESIRIVSKSALETIHHVDNKPMFDELLLTHKSIDSIFWSFPILLEQYYMGVYCFQQGIDLRYVLSDLEPPYFTHLMAESKRNLKNTINLKNKVKERYPALCSKI